MSNIVALWQNLLDYDKQRVVFAARHQSRLDTGRFRSPKKRQEFTPGVESVKRHALTTTAPLAQWPDCCRLIETIFFKLCAIHKSPKKKGIGTVSKWVLILEDYRKIRRRILANGCYAADHPPAGGCEPHHTGSVAQQDSKEKAGQCNIDARAATA